MNVTERCVSYLALQSLAVSVDKAHYINKEVLFMWLCEIHLR